MAKQGTELEFAGVKIKGRKEEHLFYEEEYLFLNLKTCSLSFDASPATPVGFHTGWMELSMFISSFFLVQTWSK